MGNAVPLVTASLGTLYSGASAAQLTVHLRSARVCVHVWWGVVPSQDEREVSREPQPRSRGGWRKLQDDPRQATAQLQSHRDSSQ